MTNQQQISVQDAYHQAMTHYQDGQLQPAVNVLSQIVQAAPQYAAAHQLLGLIAFQAGQNEPAILALTEAIRLQPDNANFLTNFTEILRSAGQLERALEIGQRAVRLAPGNAAAHSNLGLVHYDLGNLVDAEASQERALALDPEFDRAINNLGSIARDNGDRDKAAKQYQKALRFNQSSSETANNLISVLIEAEKVSQARSIAEKYLEHAPRDAELHRNFGRIFLLESQLDQAESAFRNAITLDEQKADSYVGLSQILYEKNHPSLALIEAKRALRLDPESALACHQIAMAEAQLGDADTAMSYYMKALDLKPDMTASRLALGHLEMEQGDFDKARQHFEAASETADDQLSVWLALIKLEKVTADNPVFQALEAAMPQAPDMLSQKATAYHYAMGECYEKLKRYDDAFTQFTKGADLKRSQVEYDPAGNDQATDDLIECFDQAMIDRLRGCSVQSNTPIFVLGMPRSGTTLTESILNAHPDVFGAGELNDLQNLFGRSSDGATDVPLAIRSLPDDKLRQRAKDYVDMLTQLAPDSPHVVDKMPANFQLVGLIHAIMPNAKIIHIARDPLDTCLSCYTRLFERSQLHSYDQIELGRYYNNYVRLMTHWRKLLPQDSFHSIQYEALIDDFEAVARGMIDFCGLRWDDTCLEFHKGKRRVRTASVQQVRRPLYSSSKAKWRNYVGQLGPLIDTITDTRF